MVWMFLLFVASFLLSVFLTPKPEIENARAGNLGDIRFPRADAGSPCPMVFGKVRMRAPNVIWFGAFRAIPHKKDVKTGFFSSEEVITGYSYVLSMDLALCSGPDVTLHKIWVDKDVLWTGTLNGDGIQSTIDKKDIFGGNDRGGGMFGRIRFYSGDFTQSQNAYLANGPYVQLGSGLPAYVGISHIVFEDQTTIIDLRKWGFDIITIETPFYIGTQPQLRPLSFELSRYPDNLGLSGSGELIIGDDINPVEIIYSLMVEGWGGLGIDPALIDTASFSSVASTVFTEGNGMSIAVMQSNDASAVIQECLRQIDGMLYQDPSTGKIKIRLIREDYVVGNLPVFDESNIRTMMNFTRNSWAETQNQVRVTFNYRKKKYETGAALVQDFANIGQQGRVRTATVSFPGCTTETLAAQLASREMAQQNIPLFRCTIEVTREASQLVPGDPFVLSWDDYGLVQVVMRVQRFDFGELLNGRIVMECIQDTFAASNAIYAAPEDTEWQPEDRTPVDITDFKVFESPYFFVNQRDPSEFTVQPDSSYLWALARNPNNLMEGYDWETSTDVFVNQIVKELVRVDFPLSCELVGTVFSYQGQHDGLLKELTVRETYPGGNIFHDGSASELRDGAGLICVNGEIMGYETRTDNLDGTYTLTNVHRALLDTTFENHSDGDIVYLLNSVQWLSRNPNPETGPVYWQFLTFSDKGAQETGDAPTNSALMSQRYDRPEPPDEVLIEGTRPNEVIGVDNIDVTDWNERNRTEPTGQIVLFTDSDDTTEAGTTYDVRLFLDGTLIDSSLGVSSPPSFPINLTGLRRAGLGRLEVEAIRTGLISHSVEFWEFNYALYQNLSAELLTNWNFESGLTGWTTVSGTWDTPITETAGFPLDKLITIGNPTDDEHLESTGSTNELQQDYTIPGGDLGKSAIVRAYKGGFKSGVTGQLIVELRDGGGALDTITTPLEAVTDLGKWELLEIPLPLRTDATTVRIRIVAPAAESVWNNVSLKNHTASPTSAVEYDTVTGVTVLGAWGLRLMDSGYAGALIRIRDTFDDSEQDVGADPDGNLAPFFVKGEARVVRIYDQSGNGANLEADSQAEQPRLRWNMTETGRPHIEFSGTESLKDTVAATNRPYMVTRPNMSLVCGPKLDTGNDYIATIPHQDGTHTSPFLRCGMTTGGTDWRIGVNGVLQIDPGNGPSNSGQNVWFIDYQNGEGYHNEDTTTTVSWTAEDITYPNSTRLRLAETGGGTLNWSGTFHELCIFSGNIAAGDRQTIMEDLSEYWYNFTA